MTLVNFNNRTRNTAPYFNNVFDSLFTEALNKNQSVHNIPQVNVLESELDYKIELAAPGLEKSDFQINLKKDTLSVWVEQKVADVPAEKNYNKKEFDYSSFAKSFILPDTIDAENIAAEYLNGILTITVGKKVIAQPKNKAIVVS